tara:strand:+ start:1040 stop:1612 length:573 start_codon:yes stop_codon:yes gene_type:complete
LRVIDIVILIILVLGAFRGFQKGLLLEIVGLFAFILGIIGGFQFTPLVAGFLDGYFTKVPGLIPVISFIIVFVVIVLAVNLIGLALKKTIDLTLLGSFDDLAGSLAGILKWALALSFLLWLLTFFGFQLADEYVEGAKIYPFVVSLAPWMIDTISVVLPFVKEFFEKLTPEQQPAERQAYIVALSQLRIV